ncbi:MAG: hypothetical protein UW88_C0006G0051 [Candidatus Collierbacteria bacterium GW2011_GWD2_45_10]|uniref:DUF4446 domain-containing protein n=1 Tax=Candidatus Collierbacteria bacterium GW2011_GWB2_44_22 TaxID=1618387 RepID=A0A0G1I0H2_9BACT|nr:MAG: hypothetical protein UW31_C0007G0092 [Candidatus Collierbacteria bacterium GW2011_GWA2_44_13]KKT49158.1 MAG: hypothetical protein UW42_C0039G0007 [Candidatus Collierbacteria bacterium GW2011_GWB1_44_197]KKT52323.1 MAG: hypothetical protein UW44_C0003G0166 [Candidatus Collierbacteria bacterium GW2011_GWB2_44_22]KKT63243.1 MAG: hypothetical protein UW56_C0001G0080 [Candidatus Collierbacteria bacterium GW2011_GWD1_44_27]KKT64513.1 MAG: hypothetical protein UW58_C0041G0003 [Candidatus Colli
MVPAYLFYAIFALWLLILTFLLVRVMIHYNSLTADVSKKDLISSLNHLISSSSQNSDDIKALQEKLRVETIENKKHLQRIGFRRYNPFTDTGGDQSFSAAFLDDNGDGIMISSLHSRENTRLYAKKVEGGKVVSQALSKEEADVINEAIK